MKVGRKRLPSIMEGCLNTSTAYLELAVDYSTMEYIQLLQRFFAIKGYPCEMLSDNRSELVGAEKDLRLMIEISVQIEVRGGDLQHLPLHIKMVDQKH